MRVLLLHAPSARPSYIETFSLTEALNGIYLGPVLAGAHELRLVDLRVTPELSRELRGFRPQAVVVAVTPASLAALDGLLGRLAALSPRPRVLLLPAAEYGNTRFRERPHELQHPLADAALPALFLASQQRAVPALLAAWERGADGAQVPGLLLREGGRWRATPPAEDRLADTGVPDRSLLGRARGRYRFLGLHGMAYVLFTAGCRFACRYCTESKGGGAGFVRAVPDVVEEIRRTTEPNVFLADLEPLQFPGDMERLAAALEAAGVRRRYALMTRADSVLQHARLLERWRALGLRWVYVGLDGHSADRLREVRKGTTPEVNAAALARLRELGLASAGAFVVPPSATRSDFADLRRAMWRLRPDLLDVTVETPLVGTRLFDEQAPQLTSQDPSLLDLDHAVLPTALPRAEFYREMTRLHRLGWLLSTPGVLRHQPLRDVLRNALHGPPALWRVARAARDHADR
jgi:magnesium-protoporphyrin IX monomethyl ester (oxidative) cyclase